jgi:hypothetical protein
MEEKLWTYLMKSRLVDSYYVQYNLPTLGYLCMDMPYETKIDVRIHVYQVESNSPSLVK